MFATYRAKGGDSEIVFGLEPEHASALINRDRRFERYPNAPHTVRVRGSEIGWSELKALVLESHAVYGARPTRRKRG